jgi:hypothetical protein
MPRCSRTRCGRPTPSAVCSWTRLTLEAEPGLTVFTDTAAPGSRDAETLRLLGSWAATADTLTGITTV